MGIFNGFSSGCGCGCNTNWWWIIIVLLLIDCNNTCDSLIWLLLLSRFCGNHSGCGCEDDGCPRGGSNCGCGCGC